MEAFCALSSHVSIFWLVFSAEVCRVIIVGCFVASTETSLVTIYFQRYPRGMANYCPSSRIQPPLFFGREVSAMTPYLVLWE